VRLHVDGRTAEQTLKVLADPRDKASLQEYVLRHDFLTEIDGELSAVDKMLNQIGVRLKEANPQQAAALRGFAAKLTYNPRNVEDLGGPPGLRDRLFDLSARLGSSFQAPTSAQLAEAADLRALYRELSAQYGQL
jgi:hypothetical protein